MIVTITWTCWGWCFDWLPAARSAAIRSPPTKARSLSERLTIDPAADRARTDALQPPLFG